MNNMKFELDDTEQRRWEKFKEKHRDCQPITADGTKFKFIITISGIGQFIAVECIICGEREEITNFFAF